MTIKELYEMAVAQGIENYEIHQYRAEGGEFNIVDNWEIDHEQKEVWQEIEC